MNLSRCFLITIVLSLLVAASGRSQDMPIGNWESHLPYNNGLGVVTDGNTLHAICNQPFFTYNPAHGEMEAYSKVNGMSDIGMQCLAYDMATSTTVLVYSNGNIDLFKNNTFYNIPDLKIKSIAGTKTVNQVYCEAGLAYLCTSIGVLVIDLTTHNINETYQFMQNNQNIGVSGFMGNDKYFYAITSLGLYRAEKLNSQLQNFQVWQRVDSADTFSFIASVSNTLFLGNSRSVYSYVRDTMHKVYTCSVSADTFITHIDGGNTGLLISEFHPNNFNGDVKLMDISYQMIDLCAGLGHPVQAAQTLDNSIWIADQYYGLERRTGTDLHYPPGPADPNSFDIYAHNKDLWVVHGGISDKLDASYNFHCASNYLKGNWKPYERYIYTPFNDVTNCVNVLKDETTGTLYIGSYINGLFCIKADGSTQLINKNSIFDTSIAVFGHNERQIVGLALDASDNLWVTTAFSKCQLYVKTPDDHWYKYYVPGNLIGGPLVVDDYGVAWYVSYLNGGVVAYNTNNTFDVTSDDIYYHLTTGAGSGNLPSNNVHCIAKDKNNNIWIGTDNGIGIVSNCGFSTTSVNTCDAVWPIVQYDQFAGYLFAGNNVKAIAVDGANRKWIGTDDGVWLLSSDAQKIIYRFTSENSPLPSNHIQKISIDKVTGDVYFGTEQGLVSYRSTATDTNSVTKNVVIFPNPVPKDYTGTIGIKGLPLNADVRIADINDQLVYRTTALGTQAVWNGKDYKGHRPQSGVYLVFASSPDGGQIYAGKIVFTQ